LLLDTQVDGSVGLDIDGAVGLAPGGVVGEIICAAAGHEVNARAKRIAALGMSNNDRELCMGGSIPHALASMDCARGIIAQRMGDGARISNRPLRTEFAQPRPWPFVWIGHISRNGGKAAIG
jgi:hypothetical protein